MTAGTGNLAIAEDTQQANNGVGTGLLDDCGLDQACRLINSSAQEWQEASQLPVLLLRSLALLTVRAGTASKGFTASELAEQISELRARRWLNTALSKEEINDKVRGLWGKLAKVWQAKHQGLVDQAQNEGWYFRAALDRQSGGGVGHQTRYSLVIRQETASEVERPVQHTQGPTLADGEIAYIREDFENAGWWSRKFFGRISMKGWRIVRLVGPLALCLGACGYALFILIAAFWQHKSQEFIFQWTFVSVASLWMLWSVFGPLLALPSKRIVMAPTWLQVLRSDTGLLLEWCGAPRYPERFVSAVRYKGTCPICGGRVDIEAGGLRFYGRLIGRCWESPREHVFSFDHVMRKGRRLQ